MSKDIESDLDETEKRIFNSLRVIYSGVMYIQQWENEQGEEAKQLEVEIKGILLHIKWLNDNIEYDIVGHSVENIFDKFLHYATKWR